MKYSARTRQHAAMLCSAMASEMPIEEPIWWIDVIDWLNPSRAAVELAVDAYYAAWPANVLKAAWAEAEALILDGWTP